MKKETYTVAVMPASGRHIKTFSVSNSGLLLISIFSAVVIISSLTIGSLVTWRYCRNKGQKADEAARNYEALQTEFEQELHNIRKSYSDFKVILGVEEEEEDDGTGQGGPEMPELFDIPLDKPPLEDDDDADVEAASLLMEAIFLRSDMENLARIVCERKIEDETTPSIWPVKFESEKQLWISSGFGRRRDPFTRKWTTHPGLDIPAPRGTPLVSTADGKIINIGKDAYLGNHIEIRHCDKFSTVYGHMNRFAKGMKKGTKVSKGDTIGYVGRTGRTTGSHVHYEVRIYGKRVDPKNYLLD